MTFQSYAAGELVTIKTKYRETYDLFDGYRVEPEDVSGDLCATEISVSEDEIESERSDGEAHFSRGYLESLAVLRKLSRELIRRNIVLFHGSAVEYRGQAVIFTAPSGTGKSTHARLWKQVLGEELQYINDDKPFIREMESGFTVYGNPYNGKHGLGSNRSAKLKAIVRIVQAPSDRIRRLSKREAYAVVLDQLYRGTSAEEMILALKYADRLTEVPVYELHCGISEDAARLCMETVFGRNEV